MGSLLNKSLENIDQCNVNQLYQLSDKNDLNHITTESDSKYVSVKYNYQSSENDKSDQTDIIDKSAMYFDDNEDENQTEEDFDSIQVNVV